MVFKCRKSFIGIFVAGTKKCPCKIEQEPLWSFQRQEGTALKLKVPAVCSTLGQVERLGR